MCKRILKSQTLSEGDVPFYKIGTFGKKPDAFISRSIFEEYKSKYSYPKLGEILISASGTIGRTVIFDGEDSYFQDSNIIWVENDESVVLNKFLFYFYQVANWGAAEGGTIKRLYNENLRKLVIPVPSLEEQARIVAILDKFDTLVNSLTEGLPREIELRQKQYEYYRDLLLSFPKADAEEAA
jgi:type I restriction enzyme S subunit